MKWWAILILCILISSQAVIAEKITLGIGESYKREGVNITFAKMNKNYDKVVLCVNDEKQILEEDQLAYFSNASLDVDHIDKKDKTIDIDIDWIDGCGLYCECKGSCENNNCKIELFDQFGELKDKVDDIIEEEEVVVEPIKIKEQEKPDYKLIIFLSIIGLLLGVGLVWLLWFRQMSF